MNKRVQIRRPAALAGLALNCIFYLFFVLHDGPVICVDSPSYISMDYSREPVYPLLLAFWRRILGTAYSVYDSERYLIAVVIVQAVIMSVCVWYTARVCAGILPGRGRRLSGKWSIAIHSARRPAQEDTPVYRSEILTYVLATGAMYGVDLLNRFAAARGSMYVECIMTESICIPLFYVFMARSYLYFREHHRRDLLVLFLLMLLMMSIRKQQMTTCVILCGFSFCYDLVGNRKWRHFVSCVAASVAALLLMTLADYGYNYTLRGVWMHHTDNYKGTACTFLYAATADDAALFENERDRVIYEDVYQQMVEQGLTYDSIPADADWITRTDHYADAYDVIGYDVLLPTIQRYVRQEQPDLDTLHEMLAADDEMHTFQNVLIGQNMTRLLPLWLGEYLEGLMNTVLRKSSSLVGAAAALYALYLAGLAALLLRHGRNAGQDHAPCLFACLVLFAILVNTVVVGSMIFAQTRYMIYNMALFYIALMIMAGALFTTPRKES